MKRVAIIETLAIGVLCILVASVPSQAQTQTAAVPGTATQPAVSQRPDNAYGLIDSTKESLRNDGAVLQDLNRDNQPLAYQYIRPDDAVWGKRIWEEIDTRLKMNLPFRYASDEDNGNQRLISIFIKAIMDSSIVAFNPIDDRFTTPMSRKEIMNTLVGKKDTVQVVDPVTGKESTQVIRNDFNPNNVTRYRIKEDWIFDKQTSTLYCRILGIAPEMTILNSDGSIRAYTPMFWLYYPDLRPILAKYDVYNPNNFTMRMTWEDVFEMRYFESYIVKEDNVFDRSIKDYIPGDTQEDGVKRLLEGQRIRNQIFNFEQDLWSY